MSEDVARAKVFKEELLDGKHRDMSAEVDDHRNVRDLTCFHSAIDRIPLASHVVRHLDSDDLFMLTNGHGRHLRIHVVEVLLVCTAAHPFANNVEKREYARFRMFDGL